MKQRDGNTGFGKSLERIMACSRGKASSKEYGQVCSHAVSMVTTQSISLRMDVSAISPLKFDL